MKIAILAANGKAGEAILKEALNQGYEVTAIVRNKEYKNDKVKVIYKDILSLEKADLAGFDAVITAFAAWTPETLPLHTTTLNHLANLLSNTNTRLLVVGGAGSLYVDDALSVMLVDTPEFPDEYKPVANAMKAGLAELRKRNDVKWTYLSPAAEFEPDAPRTGEYIVAGEKFTLNSKGESKISYADYAIAMVDELKNAKFIGKRFSVLEK